MKKTPEQELYQAQNVIRKLEKEKKSFKELVESLEERLTYLENEVYQLQTRIEF